MSISQGPGRPPMAGSAKTRARNLRWLVRSGIAGVPIAAIAAESGLDPKTVRNGIQDARRYFVDPDDLAVRLDR